MKKVLGIGLLAACSIFAQVGGAAGNERTGKWYTPDEIGIFTGWAESNLENRDNYEVIPVAGRLTYMLTPDAAENADNGGGRLDFQVEPFIGQVVDPENEIEAGCTFLLRWYPVALSWGLRPFIEGGVGPMYLAVENAEQGSEFNFMDQIGAGIRMPCGSNANLEIGCRYRHVSNAGLDEDNGGIDGLQIMAGVSYAF